jgi:hypothetical protein
MRMITASSVFASSVGRGSRQGYRGSQQLSKLYANSSDLMSTDREIADYVYRIFNPRSNE